MTRSAELFERLLKLHPKLIDLSLDRMHRLLDALGNPERALPPVIHVAGTNGKGSTIAMMRAGFEAMGKRVHVYTSPHLVDFRERIRLSGALIGEEALSDILAEVEAKNQGEPITFFEVTTAAAFLAFARVPADILLLEVGLGGRLDATNVIAPALSVITPVSLDHQHYLGENLRDIAREKAGIIKRGIPALIGAQEDAALEVIEARARSLGAAARVQNRDFQSYGQAGAMIYQDETGLLQLPLPALFGPHQIENAALAIAALRQFGASERDCTAAISDAQWPARMQAITRSALNDAAPGAELWLDGGHNPAAAKAIAGFVAKLPPKPLTLICGMLAAKDARGFLEYFLPLTPQIITVPIEGESGALEAVELARIAEELGFSARPALGLMEALEAIETPKKQRIIICGSLYLAGHALKSGGSMPD